MSIRRRRIADRLELWIEQGQRLKEFALEHCEQARRVAEANTRMGRYLRRRSRRWREFTEWAGR